MPRLFTALTIPEETRMWLSTLRGGLRGARWIDPENYHITLRFIGDVNDRAADEIAAPRPVAELQAEHERRRQRLGHPAEARRYTPHVTIARLRGVTPRDVADWLAMRGGFSAPAFTAEDFTLLSSRSSVGGGPYVTEELYPLGVAVAAA